MSDAEELMETHKAIGDLNRKLAQYRSQGEGYSTKIQEVLNLLNRGFTDNQLRFAGPPSFPDLSSWPTSDQIQGLMTGLTEATRELSHAEEKRDRLTKKFESS